MSDKVKLQATNGKTERHTGSTKPQPQPNWLFVGIGVGIVAIILLAGMAMSGDTPAATPIIEPTAAPAQVEPVTSEAPASRVSRDNDDNTRNNNRNNADHGSVNVNGDLNRVNVDNSKRETTNTTIIHHHHHHHHHAEPKPQPVTTTITTTTTTTRTMPEHCEDSMAAHRAKLAEWGTK